MKQQRILPLRLLIGFGRFWWDFLVGDTPEIFLAVVATLVATAIVSVILHLNVVAIVVLPVLVILSLSASVARAATAVRRHHE